MEEQSFTLATSNIFRVT